MSDGDARTLAECTAEAVKKGCYVVVPGPFELQIDIDSEAQVARFGESMCILYEMVESFNFWPSPSAKPWHFHALVRLKNALTGDTERIMMQAIFGSDHKREALNVSRMKAGSECPCVFFEKLEDPFL